MPKSLSRSWFEKLPVAACLLSGVLFLCLGAHAQNQVTPSTLTGVCSGLKAPGTCPEGKPVGLVVYDPRAFMRATDMIVSGFPVMTPAAADPECFVVREFLQNKYQTCVEGVSLEHSSTLVQLLAKQPKLGRRYSYIANLTHGMPGAWTLSSPCEYMAKKKCETDKPLTKDVYAHCLREQMASSANAESCPCFKQDKSLLQLEDEFEKASNQLTATPLGTLVEIQARATVAARGLIKCSEEKKTAYSPVIEPGSLAKLASAQGTVLSVSCNTAVDPDRALFLESDFCADAGEGTFFNVARTVTHGANACFSKDEFLRQRAELVKACASGTCTVEAALSRDAALVNLLKKEAYVAQVVQGNFSCFRCSQGAAIPISCAQFSFPPEVQARTLGQTKGDFYLPVDENPSPVTPGH